MKIFYGACDDTNFGDKLVCFHNNGLHWSYLRRDREHVKGRIGYGLLLCDARNNETGATISYALS